MLSLDGSSDGVMQLPVLNLSSWQFTSISRIDAAFVEELVGATKSMAGIFTVKNGDKLSVRRILGDGDMKRRLLGLLF